MLTANRSHTHCTKSARRQRTTPSDGASRADAAEIGGVTRQIVRDWVVRFNEGGPEALVTRKAPGKPRC